MDDDGAALVAFGGDDDDAGSGAGAGAGRAGASASKAKAAKGRAAGGRGRRSTGGAGAGAGVADATAAQQAAVAREQVRGAAALALLQKAVGVRRLLRVVVRPQPWVSQSAPLPSRPAMQLRDVMDAVAELGPVVASRTRDVEDTLAVLGGPALLKGSSGKGGGKARG